MVFGLIGKPIPCFQVPWFHGLFFQLKPNTLATHHNFPISFPNFCWSPLVPQPPILCLSSDRARSRRDESFKRVVDVGAGTGRMASWLTTWGLEAEPWRWVSLSVESEQISCSCLTVIRLQRLFGWKGSLSFLEAFRLYSTTFLEGFSPYLALACWFANIQAHFSIRGVPFTRRCCNSSVLHFNVCSCIEAPGSMKLRILLPQSRQVTIKLLEKYSGGQKINGTKQTSVGLIKTDASWNPSCRPSRSTSWNHRLQSLRWRSLMGVRCHWKTRAWIVSWRKNQGILMILQTVK